ncbi:hypothetical protein K3495_g1515 [Podosphaera aphanis]|nr:hypothetical protein K3495_g1515 [Podosphaera aphanis]
MGANMPQRQTWCNVQSNSPVTVVTTAARGHVSDAPRSDERTRDRDVDFGRIFPVDE